jgi:hypothetical protein
LIALAGPDVIPLLPDEEEAKPRQPKKNKMMPGDNDGLIIHADQGMLAAVAVFSTACTSHLSLWCVCAVLQDDEAILAGKKKKASKCPGCGAGLQSEDPHSVGYK